MKDNPVVYVVTIDILVGGGTIRDIAKVFVQQADAESYIRDQDVLPNVFYDIEKWQTE